eukprot:4488098-Prymnesium_polylepis.2
MSSEPHKEVSSSERRLPVEDSGVTVLQQPISPLPSPPRHEPEVEHDRVGRRLDVVPPAERNVEHVPRRERRLHERRRAVVRIRVRLVLVARRRVDDRSLSRQVEGLRAVQQDDEVVVLVIMRPGDRRVVAVDKAGD